MKETSRLLEEFQNETLDTPDMIDFLTCLSEDDSLLDEFLQIQEQPRQCQIAPAYLKGEIMERSASPAVQAAKRTDPSSRILQLFFYSTKTAVAVAAALVFLFCIGGLNAGMTSFLTSGPQTSIQREAQLGLTEFSQKMSSGLADANQQLVDSLNSFTNLFLHGGN